MSKIRKTAVSVSEIEAIVYDLIAAQRRMTNLPFYTKAWNAVDHAINWTITFEDDYIMLPGGEKVCGASDWALESWNDWFDSDPWLTD